jgi:hypothetical protein
MKVSSLISTNGYQGAHVVHELHQTFQTPANLTPTHYINNIEQFFDHFAGFIRKVDEDDWCLLNNDEEKKKWIKKIKARRYRVDIRDRFLFRPTTERTLTPEQYLRYPVQFFIDYESTMTHKYLDEWYRLETLADKKKWMKKIKEKRRRDKKRCQTDSHVFDEFLFNLMTDIDDEAQLDFNLVADIW